MNDGPELEKFDVFNMNSHSIVSNAFGNPASIRCHFYLSYDGNDEEVGAFTYNKGSICQGNQIERA